MNRVGCDSSHICLRWCSNGRSIHIINQSMNQSINWDPASWFASLQVVVDGNCECEVVQGCIFHSECEAKIDSIRFTRPKEFNYEVYVVKVFLLPCRKTHLQRSTESIDAQTDDSIDSPVDTSEQKPGALLPLSCIHYS
jgi:hypothetical protein